MTFSQVPRHRSQSVDEKQKQTEVKEGNVLVRVLLTNVTGPALHFLRTTVTVQTVVPPAEDPRTTRVTLMADTRVRVGGPLVRDVLVRCVELLVENPHRHEKGSGANLCVETEIGNDVVAEQRVIRQRKATGAARHVLALLRPVKTSDVLAEMGGPTTDANQST